MRSLPAKVLTAIACLLLSACAATVTEHYIAPGANLDVQGLRIVFVDSHLGHASLDSGSGSELDQRRKDAIEGLNNASRYQLGAAMIEQLPIAFQDKQIPAYALRIQPGGKAIFPDNTKGWHALVIEPVSDTTQIARTVGGVSMGPTEYFKLSLKLLEPKEHKLIWSSMIDQTGHGFAGNQKAADDDFAHEVARVVLLDIRHASGAPAAASTVASAAPAQIPAAPAAPSAPSVPFPAPETATVPPPAAVPTSISFTNHLSAAVSLDWQDFNGKTKHYRDIAAGDTFTQSTYAGHVWTISHDGQLLGTFVANKLPAHVDISERGATVTKMASPPAAPAPPQPASDPAGMARFVDPNQCNPEMPRAAVMNKETGTTRLQFVVGADAQLQSVLVLESSGFKDLDKAAVDSLSKCKFIAGQRDGRPVVSVLTKVFNWRITY